MKHLTGLLVILLAPALVSGICGAAFAVEGKQSDYQQYLISFAEDSAAAEAEGDFAADGAEEMADAPIEIKVLILPKFEVDGMAGDYPGEAQYYYEAYCEGGVVIEAVLDGTLTVS